MSDFLTFIGGAAVGTLVTYLAKNEEARKTVDRFIDGMGASFTNFLHRMTPNATETPVTAKPEPDQATVEETTPVKKATRPRRRTTKAKKPVVEENPIH